MRAYISVSFGKRKFFEKEITVIKNVLDFFKIESFVFVDQYHFSKDQEKEMMAQTLADIDISDILIAEVSDKAIGIGVEVGYAKAKKKPIIYLRNINAEHSTTVSGVSDFCVYYEDENDLKKLLTDVLMKLKKNYREVKCLLSNI